MDRLAEKKHSFPNQCSKRLFVCQFWVGNKPTSNLEKVNCAQKVNGTWVEPNWMVWHHPKYFHKICLMNGSGCARIRSFTTVVFRKAIKTFTKINHTDFRSTANEMFRWRRSEITCCAIVFQAHFENFFIETPNKMSASRTFSEWINWTGCNCLGIINSSANRISSEVFSPSNNKIVDCLRHCFVQKRWFGCFCRRLCLWILSLFFYYRL